MDGEQFLNLSAEEITELLTERDRYRTSLTDLARGYRRATDTFEQDASLGDVPLLAQAAKWATLSDSFNQFRTDDGKPWRRESLCRVLVAALERITELEDLNVVSFEGNRRIGPQGP